MPGLGRHPHFDERSRGYPIRVAMPARVERKTKVWGLTSAFPLDQGSEGSCVGHGFAGELAADPVVIPGVDEPFAVDLYHRAQQEDRLMGNNFDDGATVLAGAKACRAAGWISNYRWAFGVDDVIDTICSVGPVVLGVNWYDDMYVTAPSGLVRIGGPLVGGHCICAVGFIPNHPAFGDCVVWENSWGRNYGIDGRGYIKVADLATLLAADGEACVLADVAPVPVPPPTPPTPKPPKPPKPRRPWWWWLFGW